MDLCWKLNQMALECSKMGRQALEGVEGVGELAGQRGTREQE